jgi:hypothetical protein
MEVINAEKLLNLELEIKKELLYNDQQISQNVEEDKIETLIPRINLEKGEKFE